MSKDEAYAELRKRPDLEQTEADARKMLDEIRAELVSRIGIAPWEPGKGEAYTGSACGGDFQNIPGAEKRRFSSGRSPGNLPDAKWAEALELVKSIAGRYGFNRQGTVVDRPSDHEVTFGNDYGAELWFGTAVNTTLSLTTGCHLTREAHQRGTP
ncbi:hypothetical protein JOF56_005754 [Kibdelosporangium banguiense]|uniref:Lipoprotein n=1 Tax=Kibdelosporangium banguiense TaxID=1365924 RepID=A0ABS4TLS1_9PSEU|nr:LppA family lipoprotein [Kibdelosporangium banguiense]MBP2325369.1 hypothetical protein [Kibdelosporangium banguiense]